MGIIRYVHASRRLPDGTSGNWPTVLCVDVSAETFRRIKAQLGRFELTVRRETEDLNGGWLHGRSKPDAIITGPGRLGSGGQNLASLRREAANYQIPVFVVAEHSTSESLDPWRNVDWLESLGQPIRLAQLPAELSQIIQVRERFHDPALRVPDPAGLCEAYHMACQSDFYG